MGDKGLMGAPSRQSPDTRIFLQNPTLAACPYRPDLSLSSRETREARRAKRHGDQTPQCP